MDLEQTAKRIVLRGKPAKPKRKTDKAIAREAYACAALAVRRAAEGFAPAEGWSDEDWNKVSEQMSKIAEEIENEEW